MILESQRFEPFTEEPVSVISEAGEWTAGFELDLDEETLQGFYRDMLRARVADAEMP